MNAQLIQKFYDRWPKWFVGLTQTPEKSCLAFGFECADGWFDLLWRLCEDIEKLNPPDDFEVAQVKEKFGGLRFYVGAANSDIFDRIDAANDESYKTCEICGSKDDVTVEGSWITTFCKECRNGKNGS